MKNYHAEVINLSLKNKELIKKYPVLKMKKRFLGLLKLYTLLIPAEEVHSAVKEFQDNMGTALNKEWYITFHTNTNAIIVFREKMFELSLNGITPVYQKKLDTTNAEDKSKWDEMIAYAKSIGVPDEQCDFLPVD